MSFTFKAVYRNQIVSTCVVCVVCGVQCTVCGVQCAVLCGGSASAADFEQEMEKQVQQHSSFALHAAARCESGEWRRVGE